MSYPLKFVPIGQEKIWGGSRLVKDYGKPFPLQQPIGESWEIVDREEYQSIVANGVWAGLSLSEILKSNRREIMGELLARRYPGRFPLLIKLIDAMDDLSVQLHPDDDQALEMARDLGKTEFWYIMDTQDDTKVNYGINPGWEEESVRYRIGSEDVLETLAIHSIKPGDSLFIPPGCVHAILEGTLLAEIQENSDVTWRIYDWGRVDKQGQPRQLHVEQARKCLRLYPDLTILPYKKGNNLLAASPYFTVRQIEFPAGMVEKPSIEEMVIILVLNGSGYLNAERFVAGDTYLIPANIAELHVSINSLEDCRMLWITI